MHLAVIVGPAIWIVNTHEPHREEERHVRRNGDAVSIPETTKARVCSRAFASEIVEKENLCLDVIIAFRREFGYRNSKQPAEATKRTGPKRKRLLPLEWLPSPLGTNFFTKAYFWVISSCSSPS